jgi:3-hydroxybutyryl-CoA dehydrogenase
MGDAMDDSDRDQVAVIGAGIMGSGIAQIAATAGYEVTLVDLGTEELERARAAIADSLGRFVRKERITATEQDETLARLSFSSDMAQGVAATGFVIEAVVEDLGVKRTLLEQIVEHAPDGALLGTNTSQLSITAIGATIGDAAERLVGTHFFNPPAMMRLVELIAGLRTSEETVERAKTFATSLGKEVVVCRKDTPGFITSRVSAILRVECMRMLDEGLASAEDIDRAVRLAFNHPMGPLELGDFNGHDTFLKATTQLEEAHGDRFRPPPVLRNLVSAGMLGRKSGQGLYEYDDDGKPVPGSGS